MTRLSTIDRINNAILGFKVNEPFSITDIAALSSASKETVRRVFHALKDYRFIRYQGRGYVGRNWYRRPNAIPPSQDIVRTMMESRRKETEWLTRTRSTSTSKSEVSPSPLIAS